MGAWILAVVVGGCAGLGAGAPAGAATLRTDYGDSAHGDFGEVYVDAAPGERNQLTIAAADGGEVVSDPGVPMTVDRGGACSQIDVHIAFCSGLPIYARLGDGDDVARLVGTYAVMDGGEGNDLLIASDAGSALSGGPGVDTLIGGAGADRFVDAGAGERDTVIGGAGQDTLSYTDRVTPVIQRVGANTEDTVSGVEGLEGGEGDDVLIGDDGANELRGQGGDDRLVGGGGDDTLTGDRGDDSLSGGPGDDLLAGGNEVDRYDAGAGNDTLDLGDLDEYCLTCFFADPRPDTETPERPRCGEGATP